MRTTLLLAAALAGSVVTTAAEARGRARFFSLARSPKPAMAWSPAPARPATDSRPGSLAIVPAGGRPDPDGRRDPGLTPALAGGPTAAVPAASSAAPVGPTSAPRAALAQPCAPANLFGAGAGFCAVN